jgi:hypothetical protein
LPIADCSAFWFKKIGIWQSAIGNEILSMTFSRNQILGGLLLLALIWVVILLRAL